MCEVLKFGLLVVWLQWLKGSLWVGSRQLNVLCLFCLICHDLTWFDNGGAFSVCKYDISVETNREGLIDVLNQGGVVGYLYRIVLYHV